ncbi:MAG: hypothetical protein K8S20_12980 [Chloroflexi bacterium]|nr:hypothetical protein [Chloroflexota bacterium]
MAGLFPRPILGWNQIDLRKLTVKYEDALKLAEDNGGKDVRLHFNNQCQISLILRDNWDVTYWSKDRPVFEIQIDSHDGDVKK